MLKWSTQYASCVLGVYCRLCLCCRCCCCCCCQTLLVCKLSANAANEETKTDKATITTTTNESVVWAAKTAFIWWFGVGLSIYLCHKCNNIFIHRIANCGPKTYQFVSHAQNVPYIDKTSSVSNLWLEKRLNKKLVVVGVCLQHCHRLSAEHRSIYITEW